MKILRGFSLIELTIVIVILAIIAAGSSEMMAEAFHSYITNQYIADANWQGRYGVARLQRDLGSIRSAADISTASTGTTLTFTNILGTTITYTQSLTNITYSTGTAINLISGVQANSLAFGYFQSNGTTASPATQNTLIRYVTVQFVVDENNTNLTYWMVVNPRNTL